MNADTHSPRSSLYLLLAVSLLWLGLFQLHHELTAHHGDEDQVCQVCLFAGHLGHGVIASPSMPDARAPAVRYVHVGDYSSPCLMLLFRSALSQRGPPLRLPA